jgi:hypothetical protein
MAPLPAVRSYVTVCSPGVIFETRDSRDLAHVGLAGSLVRFCESPSGGFDSHTIAFLASDYSSYLTGEVISVSSQHP